MSIEQHSDSAPEQDSDSEQDSQFSNLSYNADITKILIGEKMNLTIELTMLYFMVIFANCYCAQVGLENEE